MRVAVIIVNYNTSRLLHKCLRSVYASTAICDRLQVDVIVVDNASQDGSADMVAREFPQVHLVEPGHNLGFTGGNNVALRLLGFPAGTPNGWAGCYEHVAPLPVPDYVLLLNADAELCGDALCKMVEFLRATPRAGACGAYLRYGDGRFQHGAFRFPNLAQVALDFFPLWGLPGVQRLHDSRLNGRYPFRLWQGHEPFVVDFILGATMLIRSDTLRQVGGLDNEYFMYCEEMDWCLRTAEAGWQIYALPDAQVIHHEGQSSRQVRWTAYSWLWRSRFRFYTKHASHYPAGHLYAVRVVVHLGLHRRRRDALCRFAHGQITGSELAEELAAYAKIAAL